MACQHTSMKPITVKWSGREINITGLTEADTIMELKKRIQKETNVRPDRQKLLGVKCKGKQLTDELALSFLQLKPNTKIMMMGTSEETLAEVKGPPEDIPDVIDDFDIEEEEVAIENREENLSKIERRVKEYEINVLNEPRPGKKLLVLDVDYTLFDHKSVAECGEELKRPYLHEFLESAYQTYDIVIWSATRMKWIEAKMQELGVSSSQNYKICFMLDSLAMISVHTTKYGLIDVKPLAVIWGKYPQWSNKNTIMFDDVRSNFIMNPQSGLKIRPFRQAHFNRDKDKELLKLTKYLSDLADLDDFSSLNHRKWESYKPRKKRRHSDDNQRTEKSPATRAPEDQS